MLCYQKEIVILYILKISRGVIFFFIFTMLFYIKKQTKQTNRQANHFSICLNNILLYNNKKKKNLKNRKEK